MRAARRPNWSTPTRPWPGIRRSRPLSPRCLTRSGRNSWRRPEASDPMTRIIAGLAGGRRLAVPPGHGTRPTSDRAREGLFATVTAIRGTLHGATVLDLYAGSGAVGLEALSRGAADVLMIEADARAIRVIRGNIAAVGLAGARVLAGRVERALARGPGSEPPRDLV